MRDAGVKSLACIVGEPTGMVQAHQSDEPVDLSQMVRRESFMRSLAATHEVG